MLELTEEQWQPIETEIFARRQIQAIQLMRKATGCGLAEAKDACHERAGTLWERSPQEFAPDTSLSLWDGIDEIDGIPDTRWRRLLRFFSGK